MSNRHLARSIAMQALYQWDFKGRPSAAIPAIIEQLIVENKEDMAENMPYITNTVNTIIEHVDSLDETIHLYAPKWPIDQMTLVDRNILRLGVFEMTMNDDIPAKVAINEAIEIAKRYGGPASGKFVNGILGAMYSTLNKEQ